MINRKIVLRFFEFENNIEEEDNPLAWEEALGIVN